MINLTNPELIKNLIHFSNIPLFVQSKKIKNLNFTKIDRLAGKDLDYQSDDWAWYIEKLTKLQKLFYQS